jgi:hypothetical protein
MVGKIRTIEKPNPYGSHCFDACTMYQYKNGERVHLEGQIRGGSGGRRGAGRNLGHQGE